MTSSSVRTRNGLVHASAWDTLLLMTELVVPTLAKGVFIRRANVVKLSQRLRLDERAVTLLHRLHEKYGPGPLLLAWPLRRQALILSARQAHRILAETPDPFDPATLEKHAALAHFEPEGSLVSHLPERAERRRFHDDLLESDRRVHSMAPCFSTIIKQEAGSLLARKPELSWDEFATVWFRIVRRLVLGLNARDDEELTDMLARLRSAANWAFLHPRRVALMRNFQQRLGSHLARAEPGSLAERIALRASGESVAAVDQVAHWLFAFDAAGMATFRALALIAAHPSTQNRAREEILKTGVTDGGELPLVRACIMESVRLWPTTPAIFRETKQDVPCEGGALPKNTHLLIYTPYFHRHESLPYAHNFAPELWLKRDPGDAWPMIPFSEGPGICPAHQLVPLLGSTMIAVLLERGWIELKPPASLRSDRPLPSTFSHYEQTLRLRDRAG
jgi:cytochrome P450